MSELKELILPTETSKVYTIYQEKGPVDFVDYIFSDGSTVLTAALHVDDFSILPLQPKVQAVLDKHRNFTVVPEDKFPPTRGETLCAIWSAVETLIMAEAEANTPSDTTVLVGGIAVK